MALGDLEREVMTQLWDAAEPLTVRQVHERLSRDRDLAYTTVMTVLDRLAKKSLVTRERDGRAWRYFPADTREALTAQTMLRTLDDMEVTDRRTYRVSFDRIERLWGFRASRRVGDGIEEIACAFAMFGGNGDRIA